MVYMQEWSPQFGGDCHSGGACGDEGAEMMGTVVGRVRRQWPRPRGGQGSQADPGWRVGGWWWRWECWQSPEELVGMVDGAQASPCPCLAALAGNQMSRGCGEGLTAQASLAVQPAPGMWGLSASGGLSPSLYPILFLFLTMGSITISHRSLPCGDLGSHLPHSGVRSCAYSML